MAVVLAAGAHADAQTPGQQSAAPEILIRGGRVVNADGVNQADVRIIGESIAEVKTRLVPSRAAHVIEAKGRLVTPGGIDPHTHLSPNFVDDLTSGSMAALAGGITTVGTFAATRPGEPMADALDRLASRVAAEAVSDVILHGQTWPPTPELPAVLAKRGHPSLKIFMMRADFGMHLKEVILTLEAAREAGVVTLLHCEDGPLLAAAVRRLVAEGRNSLRDYAASRPVIAEVAATQQAAALCESTRAPMYAVHVSSARALDACRSAREAGAPFFVETRPLYLHLTDERLNGPDAPLYVSQPPLRATSDANALWRGLIDGGIDVLATDHAPWTRAQKLDPSLSITQLRPGMSDLQFMLPMYFSEGVGKRKLPLERFVETTSTNAARIFGLYPRKGVVREGSDGDVVVWDPARTARVTAKADLSKSDYTVYEGWQVTGWPITTIRRGQIVYDAGAVAGRAGSGQLLRREGWSR
jgi:dihydropyrimidinase